MILLRHFSNVTDFGAVSENWKSVFALLVYTGPDPEI